MYREIGRHTYKQTYKYRERERERGQTKGDIIRKKQGPFFCINIFLNIVYGNFLIYIRRQTDRQTRRQTEREIDTEGGKTKVHFFCINIFFLNCDCPLPYLYRESYREVERERKETKSSKINGMFYFFKIFPLFKIMCMVTTLNVCMCEIGWGRVCFYRLVFFVKTERRLISLWW